MRTNEEDGTLDVLTLMHHLDESDMTPAKLADIVCVAPRTLGSWLLEEAQPRRAALKSMATVLGLQPEDLLQK